MPYPTQMAGALWHTGEGGGLISLWLCTQYQGNKGINSNCCSPNSIPAIIICLLTMMAAVITVLAEDPAAGHLVITLKN